MKSKIFLFVSIILAVGLLLSACAAKDEGISINLPAVSVDGGVEENPTPNQASGAYPAGAAAESASAAYPAAETAAISEAEAEALLIEKLGGHHTLDWVLQFDKTYAEWDQFLSGHHGISFTVQEKEAIINYLLSH